MRVFVSLLFLTFVLSSSTVLAAPATKTDVQTTPFDLNPDPNLKPAPPGKREYLPTFYVNVSAGFSGGNYRERDEYDQGPFLSVRYMPIVNNTVAWDYHLEFNTKNTVGLALARRWYCCPDDRFMPYARLSANMFLSGKDELAGLAEIRRWRLRSAVGIGKNFVSEFGVGLAVTGPDLYAQFGYNFDF